jgi:hypothetical protein
VVVDLVVAGDVGDHLHGDAAPGFFGELLADLGLAGIQRERADVAHEVPLPGD